MEVDEGMNSFLIRPIQAADPASGAGRSRAADVPPPGEQTADSRRLEETAKQFEGLLLQQVLKQMKEATAQLEPEEEEDSGEVSSGEQLKSLFWTFLGEAVTQQGGFGLWETMMDQMSSQAGLSDSAGLQGLDERI